MSLKLRLMLFLYGTKNLAGCLLAFCGLGLFFSGFIADWWLPIVGGLYAVGWIAAPGDRTLALRAHNEASQADLIGSVDELIAASKKRLPQESVERLLRIKAIVAELAPKLFGSDIAMNHVVGLTNTITRDLPETVKNYLQLPPLFASTHVVANGKTCRQLLLDQLDFLSEQLGKIAENVYKDDADALVVNGKFLQDKFQPVSFIAR